MSKLLKKTLELEKRERVRYWIEEAEKLGKVHATEILLEGINKDVCPAKSHSQSVIFGFFFDQALEEFLELNNINYEIKGRRFVMSCDGETYQAGLVPAKNRHGDDLPNEEILLLNTLFQM